MSTLRRLPLFCGLLSLAISACRCGDTTTLGHECGIAADPPTLSFGTVSVGQSETLADTLTNSGTSPLTINSASLTGNGDFEVLGFSDAGATNGEVTVPAGGTIDIELKFSPSMPGAETATLYVTTDSCDVDGGTVQVVMSGTGDTLGVQVNPSQVAFACTPLHTAAASQTITLTNDSDPSSDEIVTVAIPDGGDFTVTPAPGTPIDIAAGGTADLSVAFTPSAGGTASVTLELSVCTTGDAGGCTTLPYPVIGTGGSTELVAVPDPVAFGVVPLGLLATQTVTVTAQLSASDAGCASVAAVVSQPTLASLGDAGFTLLTDAGFPLTLMPGNSFPMFVEFSGPANGIFSDLANVPYAVGSQSQPALAVPLTAQTAVDPCVLTVTPSPVSFGIVGEYEQLTKSITACNDNDAGAVCEITGVAISQNDVEGEFSVGDAGVSFPVAFVPGQCGTFDVSFDAKTTTAPLQRNGTFSITVAEVGGGPLDGGFGQPVPLLATVTSACEIVTPIPASLSCSAPSFVEGTGIPTGHSPTSIAAGDFDCDCLIDVAVANNADNTVVIYKNNGNGTFTLQQTYDVAGGPIWIAAADLNGDMKTDLVTTNNTGNSVSVLLNNCGSFQAPVTYPTVPSTYGLALADFNGDGFPDIAAVTNSFNSGNVGILLNQKDGTFVAQATQYPVQCASNGLVAADLNGDGKIDLAVTNGYFNAGDSLSTLIGNGDGTFQPQSVCSLGGNTNPESLIAADLNGDGTIDLAFTTWGADQFGGTYNPTVTVVLNDGGAGFVCPPTQTYANDRTASGASTENLVVADFDGDGKPDLATANENSNTLSLFMNMGGGQFSPKQTLMLSHADGGPAALSAEHFTFGGDLSLAVLNGESNTLSLWTESCGGVVPDGG